MNVPQGPPGSIKDFFTRRREVILYIFFGGLTTLVNYAVYLVYMFVWESGEDFFRYLFSSFTGSASVPNPVTVGEATALAWIISVIFAYITNRVWVFESKSRGVKAVAREASSFLAARLLSGLLDMGIMLLTVNMLGFNDKLMKLFSNVIIIIINYFLSRLIIFRPPAK